MDSIKLSDQMLPHIQIYNHLNKELWDWINDSVGFGADRMGEPVGRTSAVAGESVSVTITPSTVKNPLSEGVLIKIKGNKRVWGEVTQSGTISVTIKCVYRPAPKSRLNNTRTPFSKMKLKIVKLNSTTP